MRWSYFSRASRYFWRRGGANASFWDRGGVYSVGSASFWRRGGANASFWYTCGANSLSIRRAISRHHVHFLSAYGRDQSPFLQKNFTGLHPITYYCSTMAATGENIVRAAWCQADRRYGRNAGKQCVGMCLSLADLVC